MDNKTTIYLGDKGIGETVPERVYIARRKPEHYFRIFQGFGLSVSVLDLIEERGIEIIKIVYDGKLRVTYVSTLKQWRDCLNVWDNEIDGKKDKQVVLPVKEMIVASEVEK